MTTRKITLSAAALLMAAAFAGCSGNTTSASSNSSSAAEAGSSAADTSAADSSAADSTASDSTASKLDTDITVVSREDGSGTRGAFVELMGIEQKNEAGEKEDMTRGDAEISNSTNGVMMSVAGNVDAIGYISLGSLNDTVKALDVNGVECSVADIKSGDYVVARPFNVCYQQAKLDGNAAAKDLIAFIESDDGQKIIADNGYIAIDSTGAYAPSGVTGAISLNGSTSVGGTSWNELPMIYDIQNDLNMVNYTVAVNFSDETSVEKNRELLSVNLNDVICLPYAPDPFSLTAGYEEIFDKDFVEWADSPAEEADLSAEK